MRRAGKLTFFVIVAFLFSSCRSASSIQKQGKNIMGETQQEKSVQEESHQAAQFQEETHEIHAPITEKEAEYYRNLLRDPHVEIRLAAASVLMSHGDRSGEPVLLEMLKGEDRHFRIDSFLKLAEEPTKKIIPDLQNAIEAERDTMARFVMKRALRTAQKKLEEYEQEAPVQNPE